MKYSSKHQTTSEYYRNITKPKALSHIPLKSNNHPNFANLAIPRYKIILSIFNWLWFLGKHQYCDQLIELAQI